MGIRVKKTSNHRMIVSIVQKRLISFWCRASRDVGKTFVQNLSSFPNDTCSSVSVRCDKTNYRVLYLRDIRAKRVMRMENEVEKQRKALFRAENKEKKDREALQKKVTKVFKAIGNSSRQLRLEKHG